LCRGYEASAFNGVGAPKKTPTEIIYKLNVAVNAVLVEDSVQKRFAQFGIAPVSMTPGEFGKLIVDESDKWGKVFKAAGIKAE
jgi:tripartite-type tricarboxylate transporter receptor subunit TctC